MKWLSNAASTVFLNIYSDILTTCPNPKLHAPKVSTTSRAGGTDFCDLVDIEPILINLESHEVEKIKTQADDYDGYGVQYVIDGGFLIARCMGEELYRWEVTVEDSEVSFTGLEHSY